jgi:hypothetical protein
MLQDLLQFVANRNETKRSIYYSYLRSFSLSNVA